MPEYEENNAAILVVDDEESLRHTFQIFLKRQGYSPVIMAQIRIEMARITVPAFLTYCQPRSQVCRTR